MLKFKERLEGRFEIKTQILGSALGDEREGKVLNRAIRITENGWLQK